MWWRQWQNSLSMCGFLYSSICVDFVVSPIKSDWKAKSYKLMRVQHSNTYLVVCFRRRISAFGATNHCSVNPLSLDARTHIRNSRKYACIALHVSCAALFFTVIAARRLTSINTFACASTEHRAEKQPRHRAPESHTFYMQSHQVANRNGCDYCMCIAHRSVLVWMWSETVHLCAPSSKRVCALSVPYFCVR